MGSSLGKRQSALETDWMQRTGRHLKKTTVALRLDDWEDGGAIV